MVAQLPAEALIIDAVVYTVDTQKNLFDAVLLHAWRQFLKVRHKLVRNKPVEPVIAREPDDRLWKDGRFKLKPRHANGII